MRPSVINIKKTKPPVVGYMYIGRPSKFGNPFVIGKDGTREEVIRKYEVYLRSQKDLMDELKLYRNIEFPFYLGCYCAPLPCHGDVIADLIEGV